MTVAGAATWLFVPGSDAHWFGKAVASGADAVLLDLEDAVRPEDKDQARSAVREWLGSGGRAWVRVNDAASPWFADDLDALEGVEGLAGVMVPKAESPGVLAAVSERMGPVVALIETALGLHRVHEVATGTGVARLAFGSLDLAADLGVEDDPTPLLHARSSLVLASRVAGLPAPVDGVTTLIHDADAVERDARRARSLGFRGKLCIHPAQLAAAARGLAPAEAEIAWAREVLRAQDESPVAVSSAPDGRMVDKPVVERARNILRSHPQ
ncbi:CoA ester lyase [Acrocarpospora sp. B8E8]|uniref:HpcH/HpaI aldolase/citrate lyase family protein n=1 Tax=Acrocarpospora sp. B8E8 TaxID=3153572 RepID=UPI00325D9492